MNNKKIVKEIREKTYERIERDGIDDDEIIKGIIDQEMFMRTKELSLSVKERIKIRDRVFESIRGFDLLEEYLKDEKITEIMVNGANNIYIEKEGRIIKTNESFESENRLTETARRIASLSNKNINVKKPILDTMLADGSRVNIVIPPISKNGTIITIRKFYNKGFTMKDFITTETLTQESAEYLIKSVESKKNIFISGSTGSGKTTMLNALSNHIPKDERVITIEDSAELQLNNVDDWVRLEARDTNAEGSNEISVRRLIKTSLRMRPDRIIVGEVRGEEAIDMLQAMNTGHSGSMSTGHANSAQDMLSRLETMVLYGLDIPLQAVRGQISSALDILVHMGRGRDKKRKVLEIYKVNGINEGEIIISEVFKRNDEGQFIKVENLSR